MNRFDAPPLYPDEMFGPDDLSPITPEEGRRRVIKRVASIVVAIIIALVSAFPIADVASSQETHVHSIETLNRKADNVTALVATSTAASAAITLLPDDTATPIAEKLADLSTGFLIVLASLYLEKYLLTILGLASFRFLIPAACAVFVVGKLWRRGPSEQQVNLLAFKLAVFALAIFAVVPTSVAISDLIEETYSSEVNATIEAAMEADLPSSEEEAAPEDAPSETEASVEETTEPSSDGNPISALMNWVSDIGSAAVETVTDAAEAISGSVAGMLETAKEALSNLIEALAVMIVTNCVIPLLVVLCYMWLCNTLLGTNLTAPSWESVPRMPSFPRRKTGGVPAVKTEE